MLTLGWVLTPLSNSWVFSITIGPEYDPYCKPLLGEDSTQTFRLGTLNPKPILLLGGGAVPKLYGLAFRVGACIAGYVALCASVRGLGFRGVVTA